MILTDDEINAVMERAEAAWLADKERTLGFDIVAGRAIESAVLEKLRAGVELPDMRKAIELEAEVAKLRGLVAGRSAEHLAAHITYDKGYQDGRLDAEAALKPVAEIGVSVFTWLGDRPPAGTTLYRIEQP